ncbi:type I restriction endonuclease subunit R [bacterium]|nr:type I restriction endonuclease subunit R [bacterium]
MSSAPKVQEEYRAKIPAIHTLCALGWKYLSPAQCLQLRGGIRELLLKPVLVEILERRRYEYKGKFYPLSGGAIDHIIRELTIASNLNDGLLTANERVYDLLLFGVTVTEFMPDGKKHHPTISIIDWTNVSANEFHVTEEFDLLSSTGLQTRRPDLVCFINGIPVVIIEAKRPDSGDVKKHMIKEGISQQIRNQKADYIPALHAFSQILISISETDARYGTTKTPAKFWAEWHDEEFDDVYFSTIKNKKMSKAEADQILLNKPVAVSDYFKDLWSLPQLPTQQDRLLIGLLQHVRLLEFLRYFIIFDRRDGKIAARYQQFFGTRALIKRACERRKEGGRAGGIIWHTTGSGKSYTMVFFCKAILFHDALKECRLVVVTDRTDLEKQLAKTFHAAGALGVDVQGKKSAEELAKATTGRQLAKRIGQGNERIIFTIINKFNTASKQPECFNSSENIIVLIDEGHRSQNGENHERMRISLPNAAYIAFTGTPLLKDDKTRNKFGPIIHAYTMKRAGQDKTVTPLLYEERKPELDINEKAIDNWFEKITRDLPDAQKADLKKKFSKKGVIYGSANRIDLLAWDIAIHFSENFKKLGLGLKGQIACDRKLSAIRMKKALDATDLVTSSVIISPPDTREGHEDVDESAVPEVQQWWKDNVKENAQKYEDAEIDKFGSDGDPDILIVVDKLLTGFDEPRNAVLYIDRKLQDHKIIQAIARVNRLHDQKKFGFLIDYRGLLEELDTALSAYQDLEHRTQCGYEIDDLDGLYQNVSVEYKRLPALHDKVWSFFTSVKNKKDAEQYRQLLLPKYATSQDGDEFDLRQSVRESFYEALTEFGICLKTALASRSFYEDKKFSEKVLQTYKDDLAFFTSLRRQIRVDSHEVVDYSNYEEQIKRLVDKHVIGNQVKESTVQYVVSALGAGKPESWSDDKARNEADIIRSRIKRTIEQELANDPYAQKYFSELLKQTLIELEALFDSPLKKYYAFKKFEESIDNRDVAGIPPELTGSPRARAYYGVIKMALEAVSIEIIDESELVSASIEIDNVVLKAVAENSVNPQNIETAIRRDLLPYLFDLIGLDIAKTVIDDIISIVRNGINRRVEV